MSSNLFSVVKMNFHLKSFNIYFNFSGNIDFGHMFELPQHNRAMYFSSFYLNCKIKKTTININNMIVRIN